MWSIFYLNAHAFVCEEGYYALVSIAPNTNKFKDIPYSSINKSNAKLDQSTNL